MQTSSSPNEQGLPLSLLACCILHGLTGLPESWRAPAVAPFWVLSGVDVPAVLELAGLSERAPEQEITELLGEAFCQLGLPAGGDADGRFGLVKLAVGLMAEGVLLKPLGEALKENATRFHLDFYQQALDALVSLVYYWREDRAGEVPDLLVDTARDLAALWESPVLDSRPFEQGELTMIPECWIN